MSWSCTGFVWTLPSVTQFTSLFVRDFPYPPTNDQTNLNYVLNSDISQAMVEANVNFNPALGYPDLASAQTSFLYLTAYFLSLNLSNAQKGVAGGSNFPLQSSGVGSVNVSYAIPEKYMKDPFLSALSQNRYGQKYLSFVLPYLRGNVNSIGGTTRFD